MPETPTPADPVAAYLAEVREQIAAASPSRGFTAEEFGWWRHAPRLLAALEAVLKVADMLPPQGPPSSALEEDRMWIRQECADMIREAISRELLGTGERSDGDRS